MLPLDVSESRVEARGERDRFENEKIAFYEKIRHGYLNIAKDHPERVKIIDATKSIDDVQANIKYCIDNVIRDTGIRHE